MSSHNNLINEYVTAVCQQVRWKKARPRIADELSIHIADTRDAYESEGLTRADATAQAITDTGDVAVVGTQFDRVHRPKPQWGMLGTTATLVVLGLAVYAFFAGGLSLDRLLFTGIGIAGLAAAYFIDFTWLVKYPKTLLFTVSAFSIAVIFMRSLRIIISGLSLTRANIPFGPTGTGIIFFSLGDVVTLVFPLTLAIIIFYAKGKGYWGLIISWLSFMLLVLIALGMSVGGGARFGAIAFMLFGIAIAKDLFKVKKIPAVLLTFGPFISIGLFVFVTMNQFQRERLIAIFMPSSAPVTRGFWALTTRAILRDAAWFGQGGTDALAMLFPFSQSPPVQVQYTSVLTALIGLMGWISFVIIFSILMFFIVKGILRCLKQKSSLGFLVSSAIMLTFSVQAFEYIMFNLGFQIASPMSLPLIVSSNAALVINMVLIGFMLSVFRTGDAIMDKHHDTKTGKLVNWDDGRLIINFKHKTGQKA